jgi:chromosomal replication initiator protein
MSFPPELWDGVLRRLRAELPPHALEAWLRPLVAEAAPDADSLRLRCPSAFHRSRIDEGLLCRIERCVEEEAGRRLAIELALLEPGTVAPAAPPSASAGTSVEIARGVRPAPVAARSAVAARPQPDLHQAELAQTFANFVVGPCNALAREAALAVARDAQRPANPLYIVSEPGLGKTHLARALVGEASRQGRDRCIYESAETFTSHFLVAIRDRGMDRFRQRYRQECGMLVLEDVHFLRAKRATQLEFFHTLSHLIDAGVRVVLTGDRLPRDIEGLDPRLRSRMGAGLVAEIEPPDARVRREILRSKASRGGIGLPEECLELLVETLRGSVRDLEGALIQLVASASLLKRPIDLELTRRALHKLAPMEAPRPQLDVGTVVRSVAAFFGTSPQQLATRSRRRDVVWPRQLAMYLCRRYTDAPQAEIARAFGRHHPSVANAERRVGRAMLERVPLRYKVEELSARLDRLRPD